MANFHTHVTVSTVVGVGYGALGVGLDYPLESCLLAGGLCGVSGMLPDLDSKSGVPVREIMALAAALTPMLMLDRFQQMNMSGEAIVLAGALIYIVIRFGVAEIFKLYTVHRGMWHSVPAAVTCGLLAMFICSCDDYRLRAFKALAVFLGFMSHLVLDEIYSVELRRGRLRFKSSFGTALKFWGKSLWGNLSTYGKLMAMVAITVGDPILMEQLGVEPRDLHVPHTAHEWFDQLTGHDQLHHHHHQHDSSHAPQATVHQADATPVLDNQPLPTETR